MLVDRIEAVEATGRAGARAAPARDRDPPADVAAPARRRARRRPGDRAQPRGAVADRRAGEADRGDPPHHRARTAAPESSAATSTRGSRARSSTAASTRSSPRGCSGRSPTATSDVAAAERTLVDVVCAGFAAAPRRRPNARRAARRTAPRRRSRRRRPRRRGRPPASTRPAISAATPTAPLGSVTSFIRSNRNAIASRISASVTVTTSSTSRRFTSKVSSPGASDWSPSAIVRGTSIRTRSPAASERRVSSPASGSTPTTRMRGPQRLRGGRAAGDQPAAADRHDEHVELRHVVEQLQRGRPLARHHERVVVRAHELEPALGGQPRADLLAALRPAVVPDDLGAVAPRRVDLRGRRVLRHEDRRGRAEQPRGDRHRLRVVAGRVRDDAAAPDGFRQRRDLVVRAAELERAAALEALRLDVDLARRRDRPASAR